VAADRDNEIISLAKQNVPSAEIARRYGVTTRRVNQIIQAGSSTADWRKAELRKLYRKQQKRAKPRSQPVKGTATGHNILDLETCTCGSMGDRRRDHAADCQVRTVRDSRFGLEADKESRLILNQMAAEQDRETDAAIDAELVEYLEWSRTLAFQNKALQDRVVALEAEIFRLQSLPVVLSSGNGNSDPRRGY
jgi:hypothetical protein